MMIYLADFGMARDVQLEDYYRKCGRGRISLPNVSDLERAISVKMTGQRPGHVNQNIQIISINYM